MKLTPMAGAIMAASLAIITGHAADVTLSRKSPALVPNDIANLKGAVTDEGNVNEGDHDATYVADDRPIQGQTFTTGANLAGYQLKSVTLREVSHQTYALIPDLTYTVRIIEPTGGKLSILTSETAIVPASMPGNFSTIGDGAELGSGTGEFITFTLKKPVELKPKTTYGFDISGGGARHYWQTDGTSSNAYPGGTAYSVGGDQKLTPRTGDHVFVVSLSAGADLRAKQASAAPAKTSDQQSAALNEGSASE